MDYQLLVNTIKRLLRERYPNESNKARLLSEILDVTETSVYQKLNGDRQFSLEELVKIARLFSVSINTLLGEKVPDFTHRMEMIYTKNMSEDQRAIYVEETTRSILEHTAGAGNSTFTGVCRNIPFISYCYYDWLMRLARLRWLHAFNYLPETFVLEDLHFPDQLSPLRDTYTKAFRSYRKLVFILDGVLVRNSIMEMRFFRKVGYLTVDDIHLVLEELENLIQFTENLCRDGHGPNPGQEIEIFYSEMPLHNEMCLVESPASKQGIIFTHGATPIIHKEPHTFNIIREMVNSYIRSSVSICGVGLSDRNAFF